MAYTCAVCGKGIEEVGALYRCNEKGVAPIHGCKEHRAQLGHKPDPEGDEIIDTIMGKQFESDEKILDDLGQTYTPLAFDPANPTHVELIRKLVPDMRPLESLVNPLTKVWFRMGLLVMRELVIHELLNTYESKSVLRERIISELKPFIGNVWPTEWLGPDPGTPRKINFDEIAVPNKWLTQEDADRMNLQSRMETDEVSQWTHHNPGEPCGWDINPNFTASIEALPEALAYLQMIGVMKHEQ